MPSRFNNELVTRARLDLNLTQEQLALALGVDVRTYRRYESGDVNDPSEGFSLRHASRRRILIRLSQELGLAESELLSEAHPARPDLDVTSSWVARFAHAFPRAPHFVGREDVLATLDAWWHASERTPVFALVGVGGSGKTSIAERWLASLEQSGPCAGIFAYSFYDDERVESFAEQALHYFSRAQALGVTGDALTQLQDLLQQSPQSHLLVLDGLEVVQGNGEDGSGLGRITDPALRRLLRCAARGLGFSRFLITTRFDPSDLAEWQGSGLQRLRLEALSAADAASILKEWGLRAEPAVLQELVERCGGHALSVSMLGSLVGSFLASGPGEAIQRELERALQPSSLESASRDDPRARRLLGVLGAYARALAPIERDLLSRLAVFPAGVDVGLLEYIAQAEPALAGALAGVGSSELVRSLLRLERLGLAYSSNHGESYAAHPFVAEYFQSLLAVAPAAIHSLESERLGARLDQHQASVAEPELVDVYEQLLFHTLRAGEAEQAAQIYLRKLGGFPELGLRRGAMSQGARIARHFTEAGDPARPHPGLSVPRRARLIYDLGLYSGALGDLSIAARCYQCFLELMGNAGNLEGQATGLRTLAYTLRLSGALTEALDLVDSSIACAERADSVDERVRGIALQARILHDLGRADAAREAFERARSLEGAPFGRRALWEAEHLIECFEFERAVVLLDDALAGMSELSWQGHVAHSRALLGFASLAREPADLAVARGHLEAARRWVTRSGEVEMALRCLELEACIAHASGRVQVAEDLVARGRDLAENCSFGWFSARFARLGANG